MLEEKYVYGLLVLDRREAFWGFLRGNRIEPMGGANSTVPGKTRKGGQSAARFGRLREIAIAEFYTKIGETRQCHIPPEKDFFEAVQGGSDWWPAARLKRSLRRETSPSRDPEADSLGSLM